MNDLEDFNFSEDELHELEGMFPIPTAHDMVVLAEDAESGESTLPNTSPKEESSAKKQQQKQLNGEAANPTLVKEGTAKKTEDDLELEYAILRALGYERYDDRAEGKGLKFKLKLPTSILDEESPYPKVWITRKYSDQYPNGNFSAVPVDEDDQIVERDGRPAFLQRDDCRKLPPIRNFYIYREEGKVPPAIVVGRLVEVRGDSRTVEILEGQGEVAGLKIRYPAKLIKRKKDGSWFIPASLNVANKEGKARMAIPRELVIESYKEMEKKLQELEAKPVEKTTMADKMNEHTKEEIANDSPTFMRECITEGILCCELLQGAYHISDEVAADLALRIAQTLYIDAGKDRRTPARY